MHLRLSLIVKFTLSISLILLAFMGALDKVNFGNFRKAMIEYTVANADQTAEVINHSIHDAMMRNDKSSIFGVIERIAQSENIEHIRLVNERGLVVFSSRKGESGTPVGTAAESCATCHASGNEMSVPIRQDNSLVTSPSGVESLRFTRPIYNRPECAAGACHFHSAEDKVLGLLDVSVSLEAMRQKTGQYRMQFVVFTCLLLVIIGVLITALVHTLVDRPLQVLIGHSARIASGDLSARVQLSATDEIGELADSVNAMSVNLERAEQELKQWGESLEHKVEERSREIRQMEEQLRRSEKLVALGTLSAGVAHEINNPLTGILLYASIINKDKRLDPALLPDVEKIIAETRRCAGVVSQLLDFSRESVPVKEEVRLERLLDLVLEFFQHQPEFSAVQMIRRYEPDLPAVSVDPNQVRQVFINLIINACHAMPDGGELSVSTRYSDDRRFICAEMGDTGCGIAAEDLPRIFDPFFTTKPSGTGLGLAITYGIIESNGGKIEVQSRLGEGTVFTVMLPLAGKNG